MGGGKCNYHSSWLTLRASDLIAKRISGLTKSLGTPRRAQDSLKVSASVACHESRAIGLSACTLDICILPIINLLLVC